MKIKQTTKMMKFNEPTIQQSLIDFWALSTQCSEIISYGNYTLDNTVNK